MTAERGRKETSTGERKGVSAPIPERTRPTYRPEPESLNTTPDLFAAVCVIDEHSLGKRLLQQGADLYCTGTFATFTDRLRQVIVRERFATVICGRDNAGKVESYAQAFLRVTGEPLVAKAARAKATP